MTIRRFDIVVNGGGIVGFTLLNLIKKSKALNKCKVLLLEQRPRPVGYQHSTSLEEEKIKTFANRVSSISSSSKEIFEGVGIWNNLKRHAKLVMKIKVWSYDYENKLIFQSPDHDHYYSYNRPGFPVFTVLENNRLLESLHENLIDINDESILWSSKLDSIKPSNVGNLIDIKIKQSTKNRDESVIEEIQTPCLIGCDGFESTVRKNTDIRYNDFDLEKTAIVGTVRMALSNLDTNDTAYQRFSNSDSVIALLPLDAEHSSFVISAPNKLASKLMSLNEEEFVTEFNHMLAQTEIPDSTVLRALHVIPDAIANLINKETIINRFSNNVSCGPDTIPSIKNLVENSRASYALRFGTTTPIMTTRIFGRNSRQVALLGDASHRVHPLAGQGLNLGINDAQELVKQFEKVAITGENIFSDDDHYFLDRALTKFEFNRQKYLIPMQAAISSMPALMYLLPRQFITSMNKCSTVKDLSINFANSR